MIKKIKNFIFRYLIRYKWFKKYQQRKWYKKLYFPSIGFRDLVSVQPLSAPTGQLFCMDFVYKDPKKILKEQRKQKLQKLLRKQKLKYIHELIQKIIQENG